jgi:hypothetical protein
MFRTWSIRGAMAVVAGSLVVIGLFPAPAGATTYTVTSTSLCGGAGTFEQALKDANANPGTDTISFTPGLVVDASSCTTPGLRPFPYATFATQSVNIVGNGATVEGNQLYVNKGNGQINVPNLCPTNDNSIILRSTFGFIQIGTFQADNSAVAVGIAGLKFHNLPTLAKVEQNASLTMTDSSASEIVDFNGSCNRAAIAGAQGANVTLTRTQISNSTLPDAMLGENGVTAVIEGNGNLVLDHVLFQRNDFGRAVIWSGGLATIESSQFVNSGGFIFDADNTSMVNSAVFVNGNFATVPASQAPANRIVTARGNTLIQASTLYWDKPTCAACTDKGMGLWITNPAASVSFVSSAIGTISPFADSGPLLLGYNGTGGLSNRFDSDALTWVQPTANQDAAALQAVLPSVLTNPPGLLSDTTVPILPYTTVLTPRLGTPSIPGVLLDAVTNAQCPGANNLISPITGFCITTDVFGKPRIDAGNNTRNIGAVQNAQSPHLAVTSATTDIGLGWNRPPDPVSGPITGYRVTYVPVAGGTPQSVDVTGPDTTSTTIPGLTLGTPYRFTVAPLNVVGPGTPSNEVVATPLGAVGPPTPTATGGDTSAQIFWTEPTLGGRPGPPSYFVMYRPTGTTTWITGPGPLSARITTIPGLTNGTTYDIGVFAVSTDGTASVLGTTTVTPSGLPAAPTLTATPGGPPNGHVALTWTTPDDGGTPITGYQVQCRPTGTATWTTYPTSGVGTSLTVTGLQPRTPYECEVAAVNANGAGPWSAPAEATPLGPISAPVVTAARGDTSAHLSWTEPDLGGHPGPPAYQVRYRPAGTTTWITGPGPLAGRTTTIPGLTNGTTYDVGVFATSTDGTESELGTTTVIPSGLPAAPTLTVAPGGRGTGTITLNWTKPDDGGSPITGYRVRCRTTGSSTWTGYPARGLETTLTVTGLQPGTPYECEVAAVNANGAGPSSASAEATPPAAAVTPASAASPTATGGSAGPLAFTGFAGLLLALTAVALLGGGMALVATTVRRRSRA